VRGKDTEEDDAGGEVDVELLRALVAFMLIGNRIDKEDIGD